VIWAQATDCARKSLSFEGLIKAPSLSVLLRLPWRTCRVLFVDLRLSVDEGRVSA
jgi:hypothetical protein